MLKKVLLFTLFGMWFYDAVAQTIEETEVISLENIEEPPQRKFKTAKLLLNFDSRQSFMFGQWVKMNGFRVGIEIKEHYRFGVGNYNLGNQLIIENFNYQNELYQARFNFSYFTFFYDYVFYKNFKWSFSAITSTGWGKKEISLTNSSTLAETSIIESRIPIVSNTVTADYMVLPWFAVGTGVGYRFAALREPESRAIINSPFYIFKFRLILGRLYKSIFKRKELLAEKEYYEKRRIWRKKKRLLEEKESLND
jgi:hypothetical protein